MLLGVGLSACSSGGGTERNGESSPSKEDYIARANALCVSLGEDSERLADESFGGLDRQPTEEEVRAYDRRATELQRKTLADLRALPAPEGDEETVGEIYDELELVLDQLEAIPVSSPGQPGDVSLDRFRGLANDYGLTECAEGA